MKFVNVGFYNLVNVEKVSSVVTYGTNPSKRLVNNARESFGLIDCTNGRKTKVVIILDSGQVVLSSNKLETIMNRLNTAEENITEE